MTASTLRTEGPVRRAMRREGDCERGRTMIEMAGVLAIIGALTAGSLGLYYMAMSRFKTSNAVQEISAIYSGMKDYYMGQADYGSGNINGILINAEIFPASMVKGGTNVRNPWNGTVSVSADSANGTFTITYAAVPDAACTKLATLDLGSTATSGLQDVVVNGTAMTLPSTVSQAASRCVNGDSNSIALTFN